MQTGGKKKIINLKGKSAQTEQSYSKKNPQKNHTPQSIIAKFSDELYGTL